MTTSPESSHSAASVLVGELYEAHGRMVVGLCRFLLRDRVEAEDAAQQVFVSAQRSVLGGSLPRDAPAWLATIARNECRARIRRRIREPLVLAEPDGEAAVDADPFSVAVRRADLDALREGLVRLSPAQRDAFILREFAGLSYDELARALGVTGKAVESLLVRARMKLRVVLTRANPLLVPVALRDQIVRLAAGVDEGSTSTVTKLASLPFAAKLAAAGAGVALVAGGGAALKDQVSTGRDAPSGKAIGVSRPLAAAPVQGATWGHVSAASIRVEPAPRRAQLVLDERTRSAKPAGATRVAVEAERRRGGESHQGPGPGPVATAGREPPSDHSPTPEVTAPESSSGPGPAPEFANGGSSGPGGGGAGPSESSGSSGSADDGQVVTLEAGTSNGVDSAGSGSVDSGSGGGGGSSGSGSSGSESGASSDAQHDG